MEHGQETEPIAKLAYCEMSGQLVSAGQSPRASGCPPHLVSQACLQVSSAVLSLVLPGRCTGGVVRFCVVPNGINSISAGVQPR